MTKLNRGRTQCWGLGRLSQEALRVCLGLSLAMMAGGGRADASPPFAQPDRADTPAGYLARLLIKESPVPWEPGCVSEADSRSAMIEILWVLHSRIHQIPAGYPQQ